MTQQELDAIPEMGGFRKEPVPGMPGCYRPVKEPVYALWDMKCYIGSDGTRWMVGWHERKKWKRRA